MNIEPPNLNIYLERKERWGLVLIGASIVTMVVVAFVNVAFAKAFAASAIVVLPILWFLYFPSRAKTATRTQRGAIRLSVYFAVFVYLALAKHYLIPLVLSLIENLLA